MSLREPVEPMSAEEAAKTSADALHDLMENSLRMRHLEAVAYKCAAYAKRLELDKAEAEKERDELREAHQAAACDLIYGTKKWQAGNYSHLLDAKGESE